MSGPCPLQRARARIVSTRRVRKCAGTPPQLLRSCLDRASLCRPGELSGGSHHCQRALGSETVAREFDEGPASFREVFLVAPAEAETEAELWAERHGLDARIVFDRGSKQRRSAHARGNSFADRRHIVRLKYQSKRHPGGLAKLFEYVSLQESRVKHRHRQPTEILRLDKLPARKLVGCVHAQGGLIASHLDVVPARRNASAFEHADVDCPGIQ